MKKVLLLLSVFTIMCCFGKCAYCYIENANMCSMCSKLVKYELIEQTEENSL